MARRAGRGDQAAFAELYERHAPALLAFVQQYVGERGAAEDVVQQTFLAAFRTLSGGTTIEHPRAWLFHVARNNALNVVRDRPPAALERSLEEDLLDRAAAVPAQIEQREALEEVVRDIVALPAKQRAALALFEIADLSQAEIAEVLDCTPAQVKALVFQARSALAGAREARSASCISVRERLTAARGGALNQRLIRQHLRRCEPCTSFRNELRDRRRRVALLLPVLPAPGLREAVLGAFGTTHGHTAAGAAALARPGHVRWIAGGTTATAAAVGITWLAWPAAHHPGVRMVEPAAAAATPVVRVTLPGAPASSPPAHAARRASRSDRRRPHPVPPAAARPIRVPVRHAGTPPVAAFPAPTPVPAPAPSKPAPRAPTPRVPAAPAPSPAPTVPPAAAAPTPTPAPATPAVVPAPPVSAPPCADHSHASEQGLAHGKGHHKC